MSSTGGTMDWMLLVLFIGEGGGLAFVSRSSSKGRRNLHQDEELEEDEDFHGRSTSGSDVVL